MVLNPVNGFVKSAILGSSLFISNRPRFPIAYCYGCGIIHCSRLGTVADQLLHATLHLLPIHSTGIDKIDQGEVVIEVLKPQWLRGEAIEVVRQMAGRYVMMEDEEPS